MTTPINDCIESHQKVLKPLKFNKGFSGMIKVLQYIVLQPRFHEHYNRKKLEEWQRINGDKAYNELSIEEKCNNALFQLAIEIEDSTEDKPNINIENIVNLFISCFTAFILFCSA